MADHDGQQAHFMSASTAFTNVQASNTEIRNSHTLCMEVYEPTLNRVKKNRRTSPSLPDAYLQRTMRIREVSPLVEGSLEERTADYNRSAHTSYERAERREDDPRASPVWLLCDVVVNRYE